MSDCISIYIGYNFSQIATNNKLGAIVKENKLTKKIYLQIYIIFIIMFLSEKKIMDWL